MSGSDDSERTLYEVVTVDRQGRVTLPERVREELNVDTTGRVVFDVTDEGTVVVERLPSAEEMRGFAARTGTGTDETRRATELLREGRERERRTRERRLDTTDE